MSLSALEKIQNYIVDINYREKGLEELSNNLLI